MIARLLFAATLLASCSIATPSRAVASAELYHSVPYTYGRFEARIRFPAGDGVIGSFFLWKEGSDRAGAFWNELDFEKLNADCHVQTNALYGNPLINTSQSDPIAGDLCASYHDYRFDWTPDYIAWIVDGQEIRRETGEIAAAFAQNAAGGMTFHFNVWPGNQEFGGNFDPAILPVHQYMSWVQYSSYQDGDFHLEWREEFDGGGVPSGWRTGNWPSPKGLSTHSAANVNFVGGFSVLSVTADNATGYTGTPPADDPSATDGGVTNSGATSGGGGNGMTGAGGTTTTNTSSSGATDTDGVSMGEGMSTDGGATDAGGSSPQTTSTTNTSGNPMTQTSASSGDGSTGDIMAGATTDGGLGSSGGATASATGDGTAAADGAATDGAAAPADDSGCACRLAATGAGGGHHGGLPVLAASAAWLIALRRSRGVSRRVGSVAC